MLVQKEVGKIHLSEGALKRVNKGKGRVDPLGVTTTPTLCSPCPPAENAVPDAGGKGR